MFPPETTTSTPEVEPVVVHEKSPILMYILLAAAAIYVIVSLYLMYDMDQDSDPGAEVAGAGRPAGCARATPARDLNSV